MSVCRAERHPVEGYTLGNDIKDILLQRHGLGLTRDGRAALGATPQSLERPATCRHAAFHQRAANVMPKRSSGYKAAICLPAHHTEIGPYVPGGVHTMSHYGRLVAGRRANPVVGVEQRQLLVAVHRVAGVVDVERDRRRRDREGAAEDVDQGGRHAPHLGA